VARGSSLHDCSDNGENSRENQVVATTDPVGDESSAQSADEATTLEGGNDVCLEIGEGNAGDFGETVSASSFVSFVREIQHALRDILLLEGSHGQDTTDDARVHTEQHATETSLCSSASVQIAMF
jgi:hypothetical protein